MSLSRWLILLLVTAVLSLLLAVAAVYFLSWRNLKHRQQEQWADYAQALVQQTEARSRDLEALVASLTRDPRWPEILESGSWQAEEHRLAAMIPGARWVRLLPPGLEEDGRLSFADLDLVRQAVGKNPPPAVQGAASERHLAVARAIRSGGRVVAVLLVALDPDWVQRGLPTPKRGAFAIVQGNLTLAQRGDRALLAADPSATIPVRGTLWQLRYWVPPVGLEGIQWAVLVGILALLPVFALGYACWRWWKRSVAQDNATLAALIDDLLNGAVASRYRAAVSEWQPLIDRLLFSCRLPGASPPGKGMIVPESRAETPAPAVGGESGANEPAPPEPLPGATVPENAFTACHLRADAEVMTPAVFQALGRAIGSEAQAQGEQTVIVGRDRRPGSEARAGVLIEGLRASGCDVLDLGVVPAPLVYFACHYLTTRSGVMVTGGSAPAEHTGLKVVIAGEPWSGDQLRQLLRRLRDQDLKSGMGTVESRDLLADYIGAVIDDVQIGRPLKVVVDAGAGVAGEVVPVLLRTLGCEVEECRSEAMWDPGVANALERLCAQVRDDPEAELGLAFDGDGDRLAVVDARGRWVPGDRVLMLLAADVLSREPGGDVVFDRECGRHLARHIVQHGGRPVVAPVGYCHLQAKAEESAAPLAGGFSGHLIFRERWFGIDDAIYGAARLLEILSAEPASSDEVFAELPQSVSTPYLEATLEPGKIENAVKILQATADKFFDDAKVDMTSGVRVDFADGWGIVRPVDGYGALRLRFEADDQKALERIQARFQEWFDTVELAVTLPGGGSDG